jgi:hypothetical protein
LKNPGLPLTYLYVSRFVVVLFIFISPTVYFHQIRTEHGGHTVEVAYCFGLGYTNYHIESRLGSCQLMFAPCIVLFGQSSWDGPVPFLQSPIQGGSIQSNSGEISALLLDKMIYDQNHSTGTVVSQMNPVHGCPFFFKVHFNIVMSSNRSA